MKLHGEWAGGSNPVQAGLVAVRSLGGWGEVDGVAEGLQLADQPAFGGVGVVVAGEPVSAKIAVAGTVVEDEPDDHQQVVGDRDGGLAAALLAEAAVQPAEAGTQVGAGPASGPGRLDQRLADLTVALAGLAAVVLAGRLACARVQTSQEARWSAVAKRPMSVPISPMSTWAVRSPIPGSCAAGPPARERADQLVDLAVQPPDHPAQVVDVLQVHPCQQRVMGAEPPRTRHRQVGELLAPRPTGQLGQHPRVTLPGNQRLHHRPRRARGDAGGHRVDLDPPSSRTLHSRCSSLVRAWVSFLRSRHTSPTAAISAGDETATQQPHLAQLRQPLGVLGVGLAARHVVDMPSACQHHLQPLGLAQGMKHRPPVHPSRLHRHLRHTLGDQPADQLQHRIERLELAQLLLALTRLLPRVRTATATSFLPTSIPATRGYTISNPTPFVFAPDPSRPPAEPAADQEAETRAHRRQPGVPTGTGSSVKLGYGLNRHQDSTTSAGGRLPSFIHPRAPRQGHENLGWQWWRARAAGHDLRRPGRWVTDSTWRCSWRCT